MEDDEERIGLCSSSVLSDFNRNRRLFSARNLEKGMDDSLVHSSISSLGILEFPSIRATSCKRHVSYVVVAR